MGKNLLRAGNSYDSTMSDQRLMQDQDARTADSMTNDQSHFILRRGCDTSGRWMFGVSVLLVDVEMNEAYPSSIAIAYVSPLESAVES